MSELAENQGRRVDCSRSIAAGARNGAGTSDKGSWAAAICTVIALGVGLLTLVALATYDVKHGNQPTDEELTTDFFSHESRFDELVHMLDADRRTLASQGATAIDLAAMARLNTKAVRLGMYTGLLQEISVADLRYFPDSGKLILVPDGEKNRERPSKSYLYLGRAQPQPLIQYHGYAWHGPEVYMTTGDSPLRGAWFIHHDMTVVVAFSPY